MLPRVICTTLLVETSPQGLPLGAACIASAIKADVRTAGKFSVFLQDYSLEDDSLCLLSSNEEKAACIASSLAKEKPHVLCFSVYVWNHGLLEAVACQIKKLLPDCLCIAGGPEVTANPRAFSYFDYTVAGQGEGAVPALLEALFLQGGAKPVPIPGVYAFLQGDGRLPFRTEGKGAYASDGDSVLRALPCLPQELASPYLDGTLDPAKYGGALWELARGCPFKCSYCYESKGEQKIAYFPLERLEKEIELFARKKIPQVFVLDPTYNANKKRAIDMLRMIAKKAPGMFFYFEARAEFIDRELASAFARIPCALQIGLQSADSAVLKNVHRTLDKKRFTRNIGFLNDAGVIFGFDLIFGLPGDTYAGFCRSIDFALSLYPNNLELFCLSVLPGTTLHDDAAGFGLEWEQEPPYHVLRTPQFSARDLEKAAVLAKAVNLFYNDGRAVPWFNTILFPLHKSASLFFEEFADFLQKHPLTLQKDGADDADIERAQCDFVRDQYRAKHLEKLLPAAKDLILMNNAVSRCTANGRESLLFLHYHPDDIMSEYAMDLTFFAQHCGRQSCKVRVFSGKNGVDWRV